MNDLGKKVDVRGFSDISDYARPLGIWIAERLKNTKVRAYQVTIVHFALMLLVVTLIGKGYFLLACILLCVKNILDAADGSLARIQNRPSRVGRFLDSNLDFVGNLLLFLFFPDMTITERMVAFLSFIIQGTFFNYYYILFRTANRGEGTSKIEESSETVYPYDNPKILKILFAFYKVFYSWQDKFVDFIETKILKTDKVSPSATWLTSLSVNGLGFQYLIIIFLLLSKRLSLVGFYFLLVMNLFLIFLLSIRKISVVKNYTKL